MMDPITLILTALVAGAAASAKDTASEAVKDTYSGLKGLIQRKFAGQPAAEEALTKYKEKPDIWKALLEEKIKETRVDQDKAIIATAQRLMTLVQPQQAAMGKYNVQIAGDVQGYAQGDYQHVEMTFGSDPKEKR